jgi:hypothetical protein
MGSDKTWDEVYSGKMIFRFEYGIRVVVFNECGEREQVDPRVPLH